MGSLSVKGSKIWIRYEDETGKWVGAPTESRPGEEKRRRHDLRRTFITLAQVDGARRDLLETMSHGPRGDIVSVYTTFPWPALCAEIAKLKIELRSAPLLDGGSKAFATELATAHVKGRNRWLKV